MRDTLKENTNKFVTVEVAERPQVKPEQWVEARNSSGKWHKLRSILLEWKKSRIIEKCVYVLAVITIIFLTHATVYAQWLLPYYYAVSTPLLILIRVIMYCKNKWQYFLLDFCYYANILWYIFIWIPGSGEMFAVVFALSNGPLIWAMVVYRNSLVFHSTDKVTSAYIHILPALLSFGIRWYREEVSQYWFQEFVVPEMSEESPIWLLLVPFACFFIHSGIYFLVIHIVAKPSEEYVTSFNYLGKKQESCLYKTFNICGDRCRPFMFYFFNWLFCIVSLAGVFIWYNFYVAHCIFLGVMSAVLIMNGGNYYIDVFSKRGFVEGECE
ncbi:uncharacterized protein LOC133180296 isoform X1 [Saccostrea echinata]|uniref:uncharacterized protein LOC133180296 isoform X1 n=1 Tax=Saccostrea echinata TaxID=191078 RepID=UPI002A8306A5|nr:uncharacterized protein LOC133180296 isoform X1 [Saccostrea echinata]